MRVLVKVEFSPIWGKELFLLSDYICVSDESSGEKDSVQLKTVHLRFLGNLEDDLLIQKAEHSNQRRSHPESAALLIGWDQMRM